MAAIVSRYRRRIQANNLQEMTWSQRSNNTEHGIQKLTKWRRKKKGADFSAPVGETRFYLEIKPQRELHYARLAQRLVVCSEIPGGQAELGRRLRGIETHGVGYVENLPREFHDFRFSEIPGLPETVVEFKESWAAEVVALSGFSRIGEAESGYSLIRILEDVRITRGVSECSDFPGRSGLHGRTHQLPVRRPSRAGTHGEGQSAGPVKNSRKAPATEHGVTDFAHAAAESPGTSERQFVNPVGIDLVFGVEIRDGAELTRSPGVDDLTGKSTAFKFVDALGIGTDIDRLGEGVVEVK